MSYFFDTYAIIETLKNSQSYIRFNDIEIVTSAFNISETYYFFLEYLGRQKADEIFEKLKVNLQEADRETAIKASLFRYENKKLRLSYADCIGYCFAKQLGIKFLTGDDGFEKIDNVEFVK